MLGITAPIAMGAAALGAIWLARRRWHSARPPAGRPIGRNTDRSPTAAIAVQPQPTTAPTGHNAYQFSSVLGMDEMLDLLNTETQWAWRLGDSGWLGDYLAAVVTPGGSLRLYQEGRRFVIEMRRMALNEAVRHTVLYEILPLLKADNVAPDIGFD